MAIDQLGVDLEILDGQALRQTEQFKNKVESIFDDLKVDLAAKFRPGFIKAEQQAISLQNQFKSLAQFDPKGKALDWITKAAIDSQKRVAETSKQLQTLSRLATSTNDKNILQMLNAEAALLQGNLQRGEAAFRRLQQQALDRRSGGFPGGGGAGGGSGFGSGALGALGVPIGGAAIGAAVVGGGAAAISLAEKAIDISIEATRQNRLLAASATEAGKSYAELSAENAKFAKGLGVSNVQAAGTTARIQQLATFGGTPGRSAELEKSFGNLAAARGIGGDELGTLVGSILSGQDEGLNRLGLSDPSKIYDQFARSIGTTSDKLNQFQRVQALTNAVVDKSKIFDGSAEARMNTLEGTVAKSAATWNNLTTSLANNFAGSKEVHDALEGLNALLTEASGNVEDLQKKMSQGGNAAGLAQSTAAGQGWRDQLGGLLAIPSLVLGAGVHAGLRPFNQATGYDVGGAGVQADANQVYSAFSGQATDQRADFILQQLNAQKLLDAQQKKAADAAKKDLDDRIAKEAAITAEKEKQAELEKTLRKALQDPNSSLAALQGGLLSAQGSGLADDKKDVLVRDFEKAIDSIRDKALQLKADVRDLLTTSAGQDNPLVKLMVDFETATERAEQRFGKFGAQFAQQMAAIERSQIQAQLNQQVYEISKRALQFNQQARRLQQIPDSQTGGFQRNLGLVGAAAQFVSSDVQLSRQAADAAFFASGFNPNNPLSRYQSQFGSFRGNQIGTDREQDDLIRRLRGIDTKNTGATGRGLIAEQLLSNLPGQAELVQQLQGGGERGARAQVLLDARAQASAQLRDANRSKFDDALAQDRFSQLAVTEAEEMIKNVAGSKLKDPQKISELLAITGELGNGELTPALRQARIEALKSQAENESAKATVAEERAKQISDAMKVITDQLAGRGLKMELGTVPIVEIDVKDGSLSADQRSLGTRSGSSDVVRGS
jgi:hypothetical protein